ncbi:maltoporin [Endozoicomonas sp. OPT23]|nr:maltoporin [Endozoicomonas sp. OPT23]
MFKVLPIAGAISAAILSANVLAADGVVEEVAVKPTDVLTDGWNVNGYVRTAYRLTENGTSTDNQFEKNNYGTAGTSAKSANQVEFTITKKTTFGNGVWSDLVVRSEYGNGESHFRSSEGSEDNDDKGGFEVKEAFIKLGGMSYLPEGSEIWAGRRFLNRSAGLISGEFWKQSSGVGGGFEKDRNGIAVVSADPKGGDSGYRKTLTSLDLYSYGHNALGGSFDLDAKFMFQGNSDKVEDDNADAPTKGVALSVTYNRDYYGLDGWSQTALAYGKGLSGSGVNFGSWTPGTSSNDDAKNMLFTSYGVMNINDRWQMGSEVTYLKGENIWGLTGGVGKADQVERMLIAVRPTYKVNTNFRMEFTGAFGRQKFNQDTNAWSAPEVSKFYTAEIAGVFTVNSDYFGRPQIKPFVTYLVNDNTSDTGWGNEFDGDKDVIQFGVEAEIWF